VLNKFKRTLGQLAIASVAFQCCLSQTVAQDEAKPLNPNDPRLTFSFPIKKSEAPFQFKVNLDKTGTITGVSVFRSGQSQPFQTLPECEKLSDQVNTYWQDHEISSLITHADLNFDGFDDLEMLSMYIPHLDKKIYCIFLWDNKTQRFHYSKELNDAGANLEAHPETKTLTTRDDWQGGAWEESTYRWDNGKLETIESNGLYGDWGIQPEKGKCAFEFTCSRLIGGKMTETLRKNICTPEEMDDLPALPCRRCNNHCAPQVTLATRRPQ
jgi:hypothetical protein